MRKLVFIFLIGIFSCKEKPKQLTKEEKINQIAAPLIANEVGDMNLLIQQASNPNLSRYTRQNALGDLFTNYCGYLCQVYSATIDNIATNQEFKTAVENQKKLIEDKFKKYAADIVYKQELQKQYENK